MQYTITIVDATPGKASPDGLCWALHIPGWPAAVPAELPVTCTVPGGGCSVALLSACRDDALVAVGELDLEELGVCALRTAPFSVACHSATQSSVEHAEKRQRSTLFTAECIVCALPVLQLPWSAPRQWAGLSLQLSNGSWPESLLVPAVATPALQPACQATPSVASCMLSMSVSKLTCHRKDSAAEPALPVELAGLSMAACAMLNSGQHTSALKSLGAANFSGRSGWLCAPAHPAAREMSIPAHEGLSCAEPAVFLLLFLSPPPAQHAGTAAALPVVVAHAWTYITQLDGGAVHGSLELAVLPGAPSRLPRSASGAPLFHATVGCSQEQASQNLAPGQGIRAGPAWLRPGDSTSPEVHPVRIAQRAGMFPSAVSVQVDWITCPVPQCAVPRWLAASAGFGSGLDNDASLAELPRLLKFAPALPAHGLTAASLAASRHVAKTLHGPSAPSARALLAALPTWPVQFCALPLPDSGHDGPTVPLLAGHSAILECVPVPILGALMAGTPSAVHALSPPGLHALACAAHLLRALRHGAGQLAEQVHAGRAIAGAAAALPVAAAAAHACGVPGAEALQRLLAGHALATADMVAVLALLKACWATVMAESAMAGNAAARLPASATAQCILAGCLWELHVAATQLCGSPCVDALGRVQAAAPRAEWPTQLQASGALSVCLFGFWQAVMDTGLPAALSSQAARTAASAPGWCHQLRLQALLSSCQAASLLAEWSQHAAASGGQRKQLWTGHAASYVRALAGQDPSPALHDHPLVQCRLQSPPEPSTSDSEDDSPSTLRITLRPLEDIARRAGTVADVQARVLHHACKLWATLPDLAASHMLLFQCRALARAASHVSAGRGGSWQPVLLPCLLTLAEAMPGMLPACTAVQVHQQLWAMCAGSARALAPDVRPVLPEESTPKPTLHHSSNPPSQPPELHEESKSEQPFMRKYRRIQAALDRNSAQASLPPAPISAAAARPATLTAPTTPAAPAAHPGPSSPASISSLWAWTQLLFRTVSVAASSDSVLPDLLVPECYTEVQPVSFSTIQLRSDCIWPSSRVASALGISVVMADSAQLQAALVAVAEQALTATQAGEPRPGSAAPDGLAAFLACVLVTARALPLLSTLHQPAVTELRQVLSKIWPHCLALLTAGLKCEAAWASAMYGACSTIWQAHAGMHMGLRDALTWVRHTGACAPVLANLSAAQAALASGSLDDSLGDEHGVRALCQPGSVASLAWVRASCWPLPASMLQQVVRVAAREVVHCHDSQDASRLSWDALLRRLQAEEGVLAWQAALRDLPLGARVSSLLSAFQALLAPSLPRYWSQWQQGTLVSAALAIARAVAARGHDAAWPRLAGAQVSLDSSSVVALGVDHWGPLRPAWQAADHTVGAITTLFPAAQHFMTVAVGAVQQASPASALHMLARMHETIQALQHLQHNRGVKHAQRAMDDYAAHWFEGMSRAVRWLPHALTGQARESALVIRLLRLFLRVPLFMGLAAIQAPGAGRATRAQVASVAASMAQLAAHVWCAAASFTAIDCAVQHTSVDAFTEVRVRGKPAHEFLPLLRDCVATAVALAGATEGAAGAPCPPRAAASSTGQAVYTVALRMIAASCAHASSGATRTTEPAARALVAMPTAFTCAMQLLRGVHRAAQLHADGTADALDSLFQVCVSGIEVPARVEQSIMGLISEQHGAMQVGLQDLDRQCSDLSSLALAWRSAMLLCGAPEVPSNVELGPAAPSIQRACQSTQALLDAALACDGTAALAWAGLLLRLCGASSSQHGAGASDPQATLAAQCMRLQAMLALWEAGLGADAMGLSLVYLRGAGQPVPAMVPQEHTDQDDVPSMADLLGDGWLARGAPVLPLQAVPSANWTCLAAAAGTLPAAVAGLSADAVASAAAAACTHAVSVLELAAVSVYGAADTCTQQLDQHVRPTLAKYERTLSDVGQALLSFHAAVFHEAVPSIGGELRGLAAAAPGLAPPARQVLLHAALYVQECLTTARHLTQQVASTQGKRSAAVLSSPPQVLVALLHCPPERPEASAPAWGSSRWQVLALPPGWNVPMFVQQLQAHTGPDGVVVCADTRLRSVPQDSVEREQVLAQNKASKHALLGVHLPLPVLSKGAVYVLPAIPGTSPQEYIAHAQLQARDEPAPGKSLAGSTCGCSAPVLHAGKYRHKPLEPDVKARSIDDTAASPANSGIAQLRVQVARAEDGLAGSWWPAGQLHAWARSAAQRGTCPCLASRVPCTAWQWAQQVSFSPIALLAAAGLRAAWARDTLVRAHKWLQSAALVDNATHELEALQSQPAPQPTAQFQDAFGMQALRSQSKEHLDVFGLPPAEGGPALLGAHDLELPRAQPVAAQLASSAGWVSELNAHLAKRADRSAGCSVSLYCSPACEQVQPLVHVAAHQAEGRAGAGAPTAPARHSRTVSAALRSSSPHRLAALPSAEAGAPASGPAQGEMCLRYSARRAKHSQGPARASLRSRGSISLDISALPAKAAQGVKDSASRALAVTPSTRGLLLGAGSSAPAEGHAASRTPARARPPRLGASASQRLVVSPSPSMRSVVSATGSSRDLAHPVGGLHSLRRLRNGTGASMPASSAPPLDLRVRHAVPRTALAAAIASVQAADGSVQLVAVADTLVHQGPMASVSIVTRAAALQVVRALLEEVMGLGSDAAAGTRAAQDALLDYHSIKTRHVGLTRTAIKRAWNRENAARKARGQPPLDMPSDWDNMDQMHTARRWHSSAVRVQNTLWQVLCAVHACRALHEQLVLVSPAGSISSSLAVAAAVNAQLQDSAL